MSTGEISVYVEDANEYILADQEDITLINSGKYIKYKYN